MSYGWVPKKTTQELIFQTCPFRFIKRNKGTINEEKTYSLIHSVQVPSLKHEMFLS